MHVHLIGQPRGNLFLHLRHQCLSPQYLRPRLPSLEDDIEATVACFSSSSQSPRNSGECDADAWQKSQRTEQVSCNYDRQSKPTVYPHRMNAETDRLSRRDAGGEVLNGFRIDRQGVTLRLYVPWTGCTRLLRSTPRFILWTLPKYLLAALILGHWLVFLAIAFALFGHPVYFFGKWVCEHFIANAVGYLPDKQFKNAVDFFYEEGAVWTLPTFVWRISSSLLGQLASKLSQGQS